MKKTIFVDLIDNEDGFLLIMSLMILTLLTIIGVSTSDTTRFELTVAANERVHNLAFYAAESGRSYVEAIPALYNSDNLDITTGITFPNPADATEVKELSVSPAQSYSGEVTYAGFADNFLRGTGFEVGTNVTAHSYNIRTEGVGPNNALSRIDAGFFRIGFK